MLSKSYRDNFDEFGNLRPDHSPWRLSELLVVAVCVGSVALLISGYLPHWMGGWS